MHNQPDLSPPGAAVQVRPGARRTKWDLQALNAAQLAAKSRACTGHKRYESPPQTTVQAHTCTHTYTPCAHTHGSMSGVSSRPSQHRVRRRSTR